MSTRSADLILKQFVNALKILKKYTVLGTKINLRQPKALRLKLITKTSDFTLFLMIYLILKSLKLL